MKKIILGIFFIFILIPISEVYSQEYTDLQNTLAISTNSDANFIYRDSEGYTVVIGVIENNDSLSFVTNVVIQANFYDSKNSNSLETQEGTSTLKVIPPNGKSPFMIRSATNSDITQVDTKILTFDTSESMKNSLKISVDDVFLESLGASSTSNYNLSFSGTLENTDTLISNTFVHFAFYDVFDRIIQISTIEIGDVEINELISLKLNEKINSSSVGFLIFSESDKSYSYSTNITINRPQIYINLATISDVTVNDMLGKKLSEIKIGNPVQIQSETFIEFSTDNITNKIPYTYYVQIKESSFDPNMPPTVEYIGKFDGEFVKNGLELQSIDWIPEKKGLFFIETFVWDRNNIPLGIQGPFVLILVK